ncbi:palmitoyl- hydrolase [Fusarium sporotrichioides]|uniref:Palmitoyl-hydrolase n=1 Tax=Fusarium sporotrichioides TaxID=5514 RepID=A0A395S7Y2_FUSSP|nr:palmitoyl- hydrolase [Fusarium sporotrichioides]
MCQEIFSVYAPCAHLVYEGKVKCNSAESLVGVLKELLEKGCEPRTCMQIVVDWCPECKASFAKIIDTLRGVVPAGYRRLWDSRLMARYWAIKSQLRCSWAVDAETVGYQAFSSRDEI